MSLTVDAITVDYGDVRVLDEFSLSVELGETVAVLGPSGSGKSSLLRAIAGLEPIVGGDVSAAGRSLSGIETHQRDVGLMFQDHALFGHATVGDNVGFGLRMKKWSPVKRRDRVAELLDLVGLGGLQNRAVHELSGGEAQRVALARALAPEPSLLMLDEPFGSLDRVLRQQLTAEVRSLLADLGQTALHVTHDQPEAFTMGDRVAVLNAGRLEQIGTPADLWHRPASAFVAEFLGHPNRWNVTIDEAGRVWLGSISLGPATGQLAALEPGPCSVVAPVAALAVEADGPIQVTVLGAVFREGRYRVESQCEGDSGPVTITYDVAARPHVGVECRLAIDVETMFPIPGR